MLQKCLLFSGQLVQLCMLMHTVLKQYIVLFVKFVLFHILGTLCFHLELGITLIPPNWLFQFLDYFQLSNGCFIVSWWYLCSSGLKNWLRPSSRNSRQGQLKSSLVEFITICQLFTFKILGVICVKYKNIFLLIFLKFTLR